MYGHTRGGNDRLVGSDGGEDFNGDGIIMQDYAAGGNDRIEGGAGNDYIAGDGGNMVGHSRGGSDHLIGGGGVDFMSGDAGDMQDMASGGDDVLEGGADVDFLYGDARTMFGASQGGNDRLMGGDGDDWLYGDGGPDPQGPTLTADRQMSAGASHGMAEQMALAPRGGDDHLYGGSGRDMFGYAGVPQARSTDDGTFGDDMVYDFHQGEDSIVFRLFEGRSFDDLEIIRDGDSTIIALQNHGTIELLGFTGTLTKADFLFTDR